MRDAPLGYEMFLEKRDNCKRVVLKAAQWLNSDSSLPPGLCYLPGAFAPVASAWMRLRISAVALASLLTMSMARGSVVSRTRRWAHGRCSMVEDEARKGWLRVRFTQAARASGPTASCGSALPGPRINENTIPLMA